MNVVDNSVMLQCCIAELQALEEQQLLGCRMRQGARSGVVTPHWAFLSLLFQSLCRAHGAKHTLPWWHAPSRGAEGLFTLGELGSYAQDGNYEITVMVQMGGHRPEHGPRLVWHRPTVFATWGPHQPLF